MSLNSKKDREGFFIIPEEEQQREYDIKSAPHALTPEEVLENPSQNHTTHSNTSALEALKKRISNVSDTKSPEITAETEKEETNENTAKPSLLDKCLPYILDENGVDTSVNAKPLYKLQSVAEILKSDSEKTLERLSEKYDFSFDDLGHSPYLTPVGTEPETAKEQQETATAVTETEKTQEPEIFEEHMDIKEKIRNIQSNVPFIISDIDVEEKEIPQQTENSKGSATITFTPVNSGKAFGSHINVSTQTKSIDLTGELLQIPDKIMENTDEKVHLEKSEFEEFVPETEYTDPSEIKKFTRMFSIKKRRSFLTCVFSFFLTILLLLSKIPYFTSLILAHTMVGMTVCSAITAFIILINIDMFKSVTKVFSRNPSPDICASLASITTAAYAVTAILSGAIFNDMLILLSMLLCFRSLGEFYNASSLLSNFKILSSNSSKSAVKLINDPSISLAMAKNAIDGDVLIAAPQKVQQVSNFMKYSTFKTFLGGKLSVINIISVILSLIIGFVCSAYFDGAVHGLYAAAAIQCFTAFPTLFLIDNLPLYKSAKKLNRLGAMIAGKTGAEHIEMANAIVLNATDIFPSGTVTLHQMKVLSENNLEDTLVRAASLTEALSSPLAPIFKQIAGTGNITVLPDSDTVKYEDRLGISGWVDNRLLFIGNRTLMETHSISVPSVEVDRKILRQGYFPVYVATQEKVCALLIIQYNVNPKIAHELKKLTNLGITTLINSSDPNLTEEMICDYFGLYDDSVKVMSSAGTHMYKIAVTPVKKLSAPAVYKGDSIALATILNCASRIKRSNTLLNIFYVICMTLGAIIFAYASFSGSGSLISDTVLLLYTIISTVITYLIYLTARP